MHGFYKNLPICNFCYSCKNQRRLSARLGADRRAAGGVVTTVVSGSGVEGVPPALVSDASCNWCEQRCVALPTPTRAPPRRPWCSLLDHDHVALQRGKIRMIA